MENIEKEVAAISDRNRRVEADKSWETSLTRRLVIAAITYLFAGLFLWSINETDFLLKAVIPTAGYILSTVTLPPLKKIWIRNAGNQS